jgi:hypothetical protein
MVREVTCPEAYGWPTSPADDWVARSRQWSGHRESTARTTGGDRQRAPHIVAYDFGTKRNILRHLAANGARVTVVPADTSAADALALRPDGVFLSNGPGDPAGLPYAVTAVRELVDSGVPVLGICLGHQLIGLALGARTARLKFGHHGMPKRTDIHTILIPGSGPIVIGQAAEFDYSGTQAVKALRAQGYRIVLINSNPATVMTDPELADATYIEPLTARNAGSHHRPGTARRHAADRRRADRAEPGPGADRKRRAGKVRRAS